VERINVGGSVPGSVPDWPFGVRLAASVGRRVSRFDTCPRVACADLRTSARHASAGTDRR